MSKGKSIITLDADDMFTRNYLSSRIKTILKRKIDFVYADAIIVKENTRFLIE